MKTEWEQQLNLYAHLYREMGFAIRKAQIVAILRDWSRGRALGDPNYPQCAVTVEDVKLWSPEVAEQFLITRLQLHQASQYAPDDKLPECTPEERWEKPTLYCVMKNDNKRAVRNFEDPLQAEQRLKQLELQAAKQKKKDKYRIEVRLGESTRCLHYCVCSPYCNQYNEIVTQ